VVTAAVAPFVPTYVVRDAYVSVDDYLAAPTGTDTTQLVPGGTLAENRDALAQVLVRATAAVNTFCQKVLAATLDVRQGAFRVQAGGVVRVPLPNTPVIEVRGVSCGVTPGALTAVSDLSRVGWSPTGKVVEVPVPYPAGSRVTVRVDYVNGWHHSTITADVAAGATSLTVSEEYGLYPGLVLAVHDSGRDETVVVGAGYVHGSTTVPLAAPLGWAHGAGCVVTALPSDIRQATISMAAFLIKRRGGESVVLDALDDVQRKTLGEPGAQTDLETAHMLLANFVRTL